MTITTSSIKAVAQGNGATTSWPYTFIIPTLDDIVVTLILISSGDETVLSPSVFSVTGLGVATGGTVTYPLNGAPLSSLYKIVVERFVPELQNTDLTNQGGAYPADIEDALDYLTMIAQQLQDQLYRTIVFSIADLSVGTLPLAEARIDKFLGFGSEGEPVVLDGLTAGTTVSVAMIPVVTAATLAIARARLGISSPVIPQTYGAVGNGIADDTVALQSAISAAEASGSYLFIPAGLYKITSELSVTAAMTIYGAGPYDSVIQPTDGITGINVTMPTLSKGPTFQDFGISYPVQGTAGAGILVTTISASVAGTYFRNLSINGAFWGIHFERAAYWTVDGCSITDSTQVGILIENLYNIDEGDSTITNTTVFNPIITGATSGIVWRGSSGLRISNSKVNNFQFGINIQLQVTGGEAGIIIINGNSLESVGFAGVLSAISIERLGTTGNMHTIIITGNEMNGWTSGVNVAVDATGSWLTNLSIVGNTIYGRTDAISNAVYLNDMTNFMVSNNLLRSGFAGSIGFIFAATADMGVVGPNSKTGPWDANSILSTNTTTIAPT